MNYVKPTIAMVNGWCFGGAFTPLVACDLAIAAEEATFGLSEINWGIIPGGNVTTRGGRDDEPARRDVLHHDRRDLRRRKAAPDGPGQRGGAARERCASARASWPRRCWARTRPSCAPRSRRCGACSDMPWEVSDDYLMAKGDQARFLDPEAGPRQGHEQFLDEKSVPAGPGRLSRATSVSAPGLDRASIARLLRPRSVAIVGVSPEPGSPGLHRAGQSRALRLCRRHPSGQPQPRARSTAAPACRAIDELPEGVDCRGARACRAPASRTRWRPARGAVSARASCSPPASPRRAARAWRRAGDARAGRARRRHGAVRAELPRHRQFRRRHAADLLAAADADAAAGPRPSASSRRAAAMRDGAALRADGARTCRSPTPSRPATRRCSASRIISIPVRGRRDDPRRRRALPSRSADPQRFLALARRARGKRQADRAAASRAQRRGAGKSAHSHTGALAGDHAVMTLARCMRRRRAWSETLDELIDVPSWSVARSRGRRCRGCAVLTDSGAFKGMTLDLCESVGLDLPQLAPQTRQKLRAEMPPFAPLDNPLDMTAQGLVQPELYGRAMRRCWRIRASAAWC